jgi:ribosomal-protein-alanine N-acetyltransferase
MGNRGRFGKYGDVKRIARLRQVKTVDGFTQKRETVPPRGPVYYEKKTSRKVQITIRLAKASDTGYIRSLSREVFHRYGPYEDILPRWSESDVTVTLLAIMSKRPVGFAMLSRPPLEWYSVPVCELLAIAVEPLTQRLGIGHLLIRNVLKKAEVLGVKTLVLHTAGENFVAQKLFKGYGFIPSEIKRNFYPQGQDALMMYMNIL